MARSRVPNASSWIRLAIIRRSRSAVRYCGSGRPNTACQRRRSASPDSERTRAISASTEAVSTKRAARQAASGSAASLATR